MLGTNIGKTQKRTRFCRSTQNFSDGTQMFVPSESDTTLQLTDSWCGNAETPFVARCVL